MSKYSFVIAFFILNGEKCIRNMDFLFIRESDCDLEKYILGGMLIERL